MAVDPNNDFSIDWSQNDEIDSLLDMDFDPTPSRGAGSSGGGQTRRSSSAEPTRRKTEGGQTRRSTASAGGSSGRDSRRRSDSSRKESDDSVMSERERRHAAKELYANRSRKRRRGIPGPLAALIYMVVIIGVSLLLATAGWIMANDVLALNKSETTAVVEIAETDELSDVSQQLKEDGIIEYPWLFNLFCKVTGCSDRIAAGSFEVNTDMDYHALVSAMSKSAISKTEIDVLIPEGYTLDQVFALLVEKGVCDNVEELQDMAANHDYDFDFLADLPLGDYHRLEGYLFPDTYTFYEDQDPLYVINKMLVNFDNQITDEMRQQAANMGYSLHDIVIIASLIEKESNGTDARNVSSVIYNRLGSNVTGGKLQFDSTIQYILEMNGEERKDKLSEEDTQIESDYNTYLHAGLPAGPICNPGMNSFSAALNPNDTDYVYFLQDNYGNAYFYNNYDEFIEGKNTYLADDYDGGEGDTTNYEDFEEN